MRTHRAGGRFALVLSLALFSSLLAAPIARASGTAPWTLCTEQTYQTGGCLGGSGSYGYQFLPATLSSPGSLALSKSACPKGTQIAKNGGVCSQLFTLSLGKVDMSTATGVGTEDVESETNPNAVITIFDAPGRSTRSSTTRLRMTTGRSASGGTSQRADSSKRATAWR